MRRRVGPLRVLLAAIGAVTLILGVEAIVLWQQGDEAGSLALATAVATFALAFGAVLTIDQNAALVQAAIDEAKASTDEAKASRETVEEMQRQRELAYKPWLVITKAVTESANPGRAHSWPVFRVINVGSGPAVNVALSAVTMGSDEKAPRRSWASAYVQGIEPGGYWDAGRIYSAPGEADGIPGADRYRCITDDLAAGGLDGELVAVRYEDLFGVHYRSSPDAARARRPEEWRGAPSLADAPDWLRCQA